jgi:predicted GNAT family acetyltransferase
MPQSAKLAEDAFVATQPPPTVDVTPEARPLTDAEVEEALVFLAGSSVDSIFMSSLIYDNGLVSPLNRGTFYCFRGPFGEMEGVALIGHATLAETRTERALAAFAEQAKSCRAAHVIVGERDKVERFWGHYRDGGQSPRRVCRELMFEQRRPENREDETSETGELDGSSLRLATARDVEVVMEVNALMAEEESGVNPLAADPAGFRRRTLRRIEQGRVWVCVEGERLVFKADLLAETPDYAYLEGVYVRPEDRRRGLGSRCLSQLGRTLLGSARAVCLLVNEQNKVAQAFFMKAGYEYRGCYDTIFLKRF